MSVQCNADMFVDDTTLLHNNNFNTPAQQLMQQIQRNIEIWSILLWASGGLLEFLKSSYFLLIWTFAKSGKLQTVPKEDLPPNTVYITDAHGNTAVLTQVRERDCIKMLGVYMAATLDKCNEFDYLLYQTTTYVQANGACPLKPHETLLGYTT
eukprot:6089275-Ditylum_brightwellii.AAC.1